MMTLLLVGIFLTELVKYGIWFNRILRQRINCNVGGSIIACSYIILIILNIVNENTIILLWGLVSVFVYGISIKCDGIKRSLLMFYSLFMVTSLDEIVDGIIQLVQGVSIPAANINKLCYFISNIVLIAILLVTSIIKRRVMSLEKCRDNRLYSGIMYIIVGFMGTAIFMAITGFQSFAQMTKDNNVGIISRFVSILSFVCVFGLGLIVAYIFIENQKNKIYLEKEELLLEAQRNMYEAMLVKNEETKKFRHDIENHLICVKELIEEGEVEKVKDYLDGMSYNIQFTHKKIYSTGNKVADAVMNYYISKLDKDVEIEVDGFCSSKLGMSDVEFCVVFSNLVKNAVEALHDSFFEERYFRITFSHNNQYMQMKIVNNCNCDNILQGKSIPVTTKEDKDEHGIGLKSAKEVVEKNGGMFSFEINGNEFIVEAMIPLCNVNK